MDLFTVKLILSFVVGGVYAIVASIGADKFGTKFGGLLSGLPSTVLFGLLFIAWTQSASVAVEATTLLPATVGIACYFLITFVYFTRYSLWLALCLAYIVWGVITYALIATHLTNFFVTLIIFGLSFAIAYIVLIKIFKLTSAKGRPVHYTVSLLLFRGLLSGSVIAFSVFMAKVGGPIIGGIFTTFPAVITSVLIINHVSHGPSFTMGIAKSTIFAWISTVIFVVVARYTMVPFGIIGGIVISLVACYVSAYLLLRFVLPKHT